MTRARSAIYTGHLMHARWSPVRHAFRYPVSFFVFDLDELDALAARSALFRYNRRGVVSLHDADYGDGRGDVPLRDGVVAFARAAGLAGEVARVELLTQPRTLGYTFNPVSFFYLYDAQGALLGVVAEINNTYGGRVRHLLDARKAVPSRAGRTYAQPKELYVSPFIAMDALYHFRFVDSARGGDRGDGGGAGAGPSGAPARREVRVDEFRAGERFFVARLTGAARPLDDASLARTLARYPLMAAQVIALIHWEAFRLDRKGAPRYPRPAAAEARGW